MTEDRGEPVSSQRVLAALREVIDPEVGVNIVDLGLVVAMEATERRVEVALTMTSPACPLGEGIVLDAEDRLRALAGVEEVRVRLAWETPWGPERMTPAARRLLGWES
jgi:metal-sulfur cluster biosynthetic enzyme